MFVKIIKVYNISKTTIFFGLTSKTVSLNVANTDMTEITNGVKNLNSLVNIINEQTPLGTLILQKTTGIFVVRIIDCF